VGLASWLWITLSGTEFTIVGMVNDEANYQTAYFCKSSYSQVEYKCSMTCITAGLCLNFSDVINVEYKRKSQPTNRRPVNLTIGKLLPDDSLCFLY
jgi:hypothetical protein